MSVAIAWRISLPGLAFVEIDDGMSLPPGPSADTARLSQKSTFALQDARHSEVGLLQVARIVAACFRAGVPRVVALTTFWALTERLLCANFLRLAAAVRPYVPRSFCFNTVRRTHEGERGGGARGSSKEGSPSELGDPSGTGAMLGSSSGAQPRLQLGLDDDWRSDGREVPEELRVRQCRTDAAVAAWIVAESLGRRPVVVVYGYSVHEVLRVQHAGQVVAPRGVSRYPNG